MTRLVACAAVLATTISPAPAQQLPAQQLPAQQLPAQQLPANKSAEQAQRRAATGNLVGHGGPVKAIAIGGDLNDNSAITGSFDYSAIVWSLNGNGTDPKIRHRLADHNGAVNAVAFAARDRALTAGDDSIVRLWDLTTGKLLAKFEGHDPGSKIVGLSVTHDLRKPRTDNDTIWAVSAGWDRTARLWNLRTQTAGPVLRDHTGPVNAAVFSGDGKSVFTASADGYIRAFDVASGALLRTVYKAGQGVNALLRLTSGNNDPKPMSGGRVEHARDHLLFGGLSGQSGIIDARSGEIVLMLPEAQRPILALADGTRASVEGEAKPGIVAIGSGDGRVRIFRDTDGQMVQEYKSAFGPVWALAVRRSGFHDQATAAYYAGLDDFVTLWPFAPRATFEPVDASQYPRRFQQTAATSDDPIAKGELQFARKCSICHTLTPDGGNRAGPTLHNVFGRKIATLPGYNFSPELKTLDIVWSAETIAKLFELGPDKFTPGSKMPLQVMSDKSERDALIAFLAAATK